MTDSKSKHIAKVMYVDLHRQLFKDVSIVLPTASEALQARLKSILSDPDGVIAHVPDVERACDKTYDLDTIGTLQVTVDGVTVSELVVAVGEEWTPTTMCYAWLICASAVVHEHPQHLEEFRRIMSGEPPKKRRSSDDAPGKRGESSDTSKQLFECYMTHFQTCKEQETQCKNRALDGVFEKFMLKDNMVCKLAREIFDELDLKGKCEGGDIESMLSDVTQSNMFQDIFQKVNTKIRPKLQSAELDQQKLVEECQEMASHLRDALPNIVPGEGAPDLVTLMNNMFGLGRCPQNDRRKTKPSKHHKKQQK